MDIKENLNSIFCEVFDDNDISIQPEMTANDIDGWDSLSHVNLIVTIESRFKIRFSQKEILTFKNIGDLLNCITGKITV